MLWTVFGSRAFESSFFTNSIINIWNDTPENVVNAKNLNILKNSIDTDLRDYMYSIEGKLDALFQFP